MEGSNKGSFAMSSLIQRYLEYRRVGHGRLAAFRFAWVVVAARRGPLHIN